MKQKVKLTGRTLAFNVVRSLIAGVQATRYKFDMGIVIIAIHLPKIATLTFRPCAKSVKVQQFPPEKSVDQAVSETINLLLEQALEAHARTTPIRKRRR